MEGEEVAALDPTCYGLVDHNKLYNVNGIVWLNSIEDHIIGKTKAMFPLSEIVHHLHSVYIGQIAFEYMHSPIKSKCLWWSHPLESLAKGPWQPLSKDEKWKIWSLMMHSKVFDRFLQAKFLNFKHYGLEGAESMLPALDPLFHVASQGEDVFIVYGSVACFFADWSCPCSWCGEHCTMHAASG